MNAWRYGIASAVVCSGILVVPTGAASPSGEPQQAATPAVVAPVAPTASQEGQRRGSQDRGFGPARSWDGMGMRGFSVALVIGDLTGASTADNLPAGAKKALSDMRDFLPYKSYRLLDTHWILCCSNSQASVAGRLRGAEEDEYSFQIYARPVGESAELAITFSLRDVGAVVSGTGGQAATSVLSSADRSHRMAELIRERDDLQRRYELLTKNFDEGHPDRAKVHDDMTRNARQIRELEQGLAASRRLSQTSNRPVLDSTFNMKVGETVVIGTSRLKGDKALIALLTAASRTTTAAR